MVIDIFTSTFVVENCIITVHLTLSHIKDVKLPAFFRLSCIISSVTGGKREHVLHWGYVETEAAQNPFKNIQALPPAYSRPVHVGFLVDKVALVHVLLQVPRFSPAGVIPPTLRKCKAKGKSVPLQAWSGPEGCRKLSFPDFMTTTPDGGKVVSLTHRPPLPPGNTPGTHF